MSDLRLILDENIEAEIENIRSFNLSYEFDEFSPNINLTSDFNPIFRGLNNDRGGYQYILDYIRDNPGINIPAKVKDTSRNEILKRAEKASKKYDSLLNQFNELKAQLPEEERGKLAVVNQLKNAIKNRNSKEAFEIAERMQKVVKEYSTK